MGKTSQQVLETYEKKIIDLSRRNRLLKYPKSARSIDFSMTLDEFQSHFGIIQELEIAFVHKDILSLEQEELKNALPIAKQDALLPLEEKDEEEPPWIPPTKPDGKKLITTLTSLRLDTKRKFEEHGLHTLFISIGKVQWKEAQAGRGSSEVKKNEYDYNAPLLLIPVIIEEKKVPKKTIVRIYDEVSDITVNKVLSLLLEKEHGSRKLILNETLLADLPALVNDLKDQVTNIFSELHIPVNILEDIQIGQYTFYGQQIYEDIKTHEDIMLENPFLNALCTHTPISQENLSIPIENSDSFLTPKDDFTVMDADKSQLEVIERVIQGNNLNVQGPPGTGKSQTIVNIIANLIARDKKVLLVCEKQVALEVVLDRLKDVGLDKLCLPLFRYNADKKTFAKSIIDDREALSKTGQNNHLDEELKYREKDIQQLRAYADALGANVEPLDKSVFWVHGELAKNKDGAPHAIPWEGNNPLGVTHEEYRNARNILDTLDTLLAIVRDPKHLHWKIVNKEQYSPDYFSRIQHVLKSISSNILDLQETTSSVVLWNTLHEVQTYLKSIDDISALPTLPPVLKTSVSLEDLVKILQSMTTYLNEFVKKEKSFAKPIELPEQWKSFNLEKYLDIFIEDIEISQLHSIAPLFSFACTNVQTASDTLQNMKSQKSIQDMPLVQLLTNKDILSVDANISKLKNWEDKTALEELSPTLQNLALLNKRLLEIKKVLDKWGVIEQTLDLQEAQEICLRFIEKYNFINRFFSGQYKKDAGSIKNWCNAKSPASFSEYKEIAQAVNDQLQQKEKLSILLNSFNAKYAKRNEGLDIGMIFQINESVKAVCLFLESNNREKLSPEYASFMVNNHNQESKNALRDAMVGFEKQFSEIVKKLPEFNITGDITFSEFISNITAVTEKVVFLDELSQSMPKILTNIKDLPTTVKKLLSDASKIDELVIIRDNYNKLPLASYFDHAPSFHESIKDIKGITNLLETVLSLEAATCDLNLKNKKPLTIEYLQKLIEEKKTVYRQLQKPLGEMESNCNSLDTLLLTKSPLFIDLETIPLNELSTQMDAMTNDEEGLASWMQFNKYTKRMTELGFGWFVEEIFKDKTVENPTPLFSVTLWQAWLDLYYEKTPALRNFTLQDHKRLIKEFREFDSKSRKINALRTLQHMAAKIRDAKWRYSVLERELVHQSQLKMRHKPIRKLVNEIGNQIIQYKPCWMMSPLTLSSYIPFGTLDFDVVIFDEASQMRVEHALGSIARAKQVVIFGDENQLPPTSFFDVTDSTEEDDDEEDYESILHATKEILPGADRLLSYHYRSKYEDLIAYSNHYIYSDELTTFPNPTLFNPIEFVYLENGVFDGGKEGTRKNIVEADKVAQLCINHVKEYPKKSLGVIAFSKTQEAAIRDSLEKLKGDHPECEELLNEDSDKFEKFFIKNLESVQGDERDVIILSVGYGNGKIGKPQQRFGPINSNNGYRRLNVAVTRAKEKVILVTSMKATDINSEKASRGVKLLQKYLEYAERGKQTLQASKLVQVQNDIAVDSPFEEEVEKALQEVGFIVHRQVGASGYKIDLAIVNPRNENEYLLGIECDGATYHSSYSARMNDRIRQENLERLGWKLYRIWSQHWTTHSGEIIDDIISVVADH